MKKLFLIPLLFLLVAPLFAAAQTAPAPFCAGGAGTCTYIPLEPLPGQQKGPLNFATYVGNAFKVFIVLGSMIAVGVLVFGGISYMVSEVVPHKDWARQKIQQAVWALLLLLSSYLILSTINPDLTIFRFDSKVGTINPLKDVPFIGGAPGTSAASAPTPQSAAQSNAQVAACYSRPGYFPNGYNTDGSVRCDPTAPIGSTPP